MFNLVINSAWKGVDGVDHQYLALKTKAGEAQRQKLELLTTKKSSCLKHRRYRILPYAYSRIYKFAIQATIMQNVASIRTNHLMIGKMSNTSLSLLPARITPAFLLNKNSSHFNLSKRFHRTNALDPASLVDTATTTTHAVYELAAFDSATAGTLNLILRPVLSLSSLLMIVRIVMTWYPEVDGESMPWLIAVKPTGQSVYTKKSFCFYM